jgi:sugar lactone lactonase YvrE
VRHHHPLDDTTARGQLFVSKSEGEAPGYPDKMKVDQKGNLYYTGPAGSHSDNEFFEIRGPLNSSMGTQCRASKTDIAGTEGGTGL